MDLKSISRLKLFKPKEQYQLTDHIPMTVDVLHRIQRTIGQYPAETGGFLGTSDGKTIDHFYFDYSAKTTGGTYTPDTEAVNKIIKKWNEEGIKLVGNIHSHPDGYPTPSHADVEYAQRIMEAFDLDQFYVIIGQLGRCF